MPDRHHIEWAPVAQDDVDQILEYIATRDCVGAAVLLHDKLLHGIEKLVLHPERCRIPPEFRTLGVTEYRELVIAPYSVFYRIRGNAVSIVGVLDRRRDLEDILLQRVLRS